MTEIRQVRLVIPIQTGELIENQITRERTRRAQFMNWRLQEISELQLSRLLEKDYCHWQGYIELLDYHKRSRLEQLVLIYLCHIRYVALALSVSEDKFLASQSWVNKWLPLLWQNLGRYFGINTKQLQFNKIAELVEPVRSQLATILSEPPSARFIYLLKKKEF
ncbi:MAG: hypothetical protein J6X75_04180 [Clostridia bacterium]|nr:hypothetical protein [Clostridia bacterium]